MKFYLFWLLCDLENVFDFCVISAKINSRWVKTFFHGNAMYILRLEFFMPMYVVFVVHILILLYYLLNQMNWSTNTRMQCQMWLFWNPWGRPSCMEWTQPTWPIFLICDGRNSTALFITSLMQVSMALKPIHTWLCKPLIN